MSVDRRAASTDDPLVDSTAASKAVHWAPDLVVLKVVLMGDWMVVLMDAKKADSMERMSVVMTAVHWVGHWVEATALQWVEWMGWNSAAKWALRTVESTAALMVDLLGVPTVVHWAAY